MEFDSDEHSIKIAQFQNSAEMHFLAECTFFDEVQDNKHLKMFECTIECFKCTTDYLVLMNC